MTVMKVLQSGSVFHLSDEMDMKQHDQLPPDIYVVRLNPLKGYYLQGVSDFELPAKIYSTLTKNVERIVQTYMNRPLSTGVMLSGEKGSGKTLTAKMVCKALVAEGVPTILVNEPFHGEAFNQFIQAVPGRAVVFFDEYEKVYPKNIQEQTLTLFDGVYPSQKLFIVTVNDKWNIGDFMHNRPGRMYYNIEFVGLPADFIREYCEDRLSNKKYTEQVVQLTGAFEKFNFDMLQALVEEMNRFDEDPAEAIKLLNIKLYQFGRDSGDVYDTLLFLDGKPVNPKQYSRAISTTNPLLVSELSLNVFALRDLEEYEEDDEGNEIKKPAANGDVFAAIDASTYGDRYLKFRLSELVTADARTGTFVYQKDKWKLVITKQKQEAFDFRKHAMGYDNSLVFTD